MIHKRKRILCRASCVFFTCELISATIDNEIVIVLIYMLGSMSSHFLKAGLRILPSQLLRISHVNTAQQNRDSYFKKKNTCFKQKIA